ncbi:MAG: DUF1987 domain-containing protein [Bacteroidales bacterium]|nr:DUF1987 domain-containing protein [Bacteroidales bacterium]
MKTDLYIQGTDNTPEVMFGLNGEFKIWGRIVTENVPGLFEPILKWISDYQHKNVIFNIYFDYINSSASMHLFILLKKLEENEAIQNIIVNWHYDEDDEDHLDTGEIFEDKLNRTKFNYFEESLELAA